MSELRERLERETELGASIGDGWWPYVEAAATLLDAAYPGWKSGQIKEKFGGLRFYITPAPFRDKKEGDERDEIWYDDWARRWYAEQEAIADAAERACQNVCETCGKPAETKSVNYWIHTLCPEHFAQYEEERTMRNLKTNAT